MSPRVTPRQRVARESAEAWAALGISSGDRDAQERWIDTGEVYAPGGQFSYFRDLTRVQLSEHSVVAPDGRAGSRGDAFGGSHVEGTLESARARLQTVEQRDVTSADPGALSFLGPGYLGEQFSTAARAQGTLAAALGLRPLAKGVRRIDIPRLDTGASAAVHIEGAGVSQTDIDAASQAGNIATIAGMQELSFQAASFIDPADDVVIARDLGLAIGAQLDNQLIAGSNSSGQTLGLATVTGIKTVTWTDASATSQEFVAQCWKGYDTIANGGQGVADPANYLVVMHPRRLAWAYHNPQGSQAIAPAVPGRIVACAGLRTNLGAGTNEDEVYVLLADELPVYASPVRFIVDDETLSGTMQVRLVASVFVGTGFGRAPAAISRMSGTGLIAPVL
jgi:hypothetical protein